MVTGPGSRIFRPDFPFCDTVQRKMTCERLARQTKDRGDEKAWPRLAVRGKENVVTSECVAVSTVKGARIKSVVTLSPLAMVALALIEALRSSTWLMSIQHLDATLYTPPMPRLSPLVP
jgi:hypothetical protein